MHKDGCPRILTTLLQQQEQGHHPPRQEHGVFLPRELGRPASEHPQHPWPIARPPLLSPQAPRPPGARLKPLLQQSPARPPPGHPLTPGPQRCSNGKTGLTAPEGRGTQGTQGKFPGHSSKTPGAGFQLLLEVPFYMARLRPLPQGWGHIQSSAVTTETSSPALMSNPGDNDSGRLRAYSDDWAG